MIGRQQITKQDNDYVEELDYEELHRKVLKRLDAQSELIERRNTEIHNLESAIIKIVAIIVIAIMLIIAHFY